ncbi:hypothetical protein ANCCEY_06597 [Ancylostoma ceylanicum]|uniref:G-protein coupled receptors family 1 profile domain-containing protein n=1 Tax=Ancylostoma ceylanicum TaxID=53326 RepID=A0A0D6LR42_9BILA|nr:hypothetical protein ANCCEY_06597 [Ancylostoma ceylanicum]
MNDSDITDESMVPTTPEICNYEQPPMTNIRFWLVTVFGSTVSFISIVNNILLFYVFFSKKHHRTSHNVYLMLLAFFDIFVSTAYILLMSVNILIDYLISPTLMQIWYSYMVPMITISHVAMTSSSFLIVCASFERYCLTVNSTFLPFAQKYRNLATIIAPFFILAYFNIRIVKALTKHTKMTVCQLAGNALVEKAKRKATARAATRTLVMVVCCYLISNIISVALTIWEHLDRDTLMEYVNFYAIAIDLVSLLTTSACACRLPIYLTCQPSLRREIKEVVFSLPCCRKGMVEDSEYLVMDKSSMTASTRVTSAINQDLVYKRCSTGCALVDEPQVITEAVLQPIVLASTEDTKICLSSAYETLL